MDDDRNIIDAEYEEVAKTDVDIIEEDQLKQMQEMKEHLIEKFSTSSVLYKIYEDRGWLDKLFTKKILLMDRHREYSTAEVADLLDTKAYVINNKRKELKDYIQPIEYESAWKHNYISVFKLKMVHGLTGDEGDFTIPQIKEILSGRLNQKQSGDKSVPTDRLFEEFNRLKQVVEGMQEKLNETEEKTKRREEAVEQLLTHMEKMSSDYYRLRKAFDALKEAGLYTIDEKDGEVIYLPTDKLKSLPDASNSTDERISKLEMYMKEDVLNKKMEDLQEAKEKKIKEVMEEAFKLYERSMNDSYSMDVREIALKELEELINKYPDHSFEIRKFLVDARKNVEEDKKGFFSRLFGRKK